MVLKVDPEQIKAEAKSIVDNSNRYYSLITGIRDSMEFLVYESTAKGQAVLAAKNQAKAHIVAIDYFENISREILIKYNNLLTAISNNEITERLNERDIRLQIKNMKDVYKLYDNKIKNINYIQRNFEFYSSWFDDLKKQYEKLRENALLLKEKYEEKLENLIKFETATSTYFSSVNELIMKQNSLLEELCIAGVSGKFPTSKLPKMLVLEEELKKKDIDVDELLFYTDKNGNKVISVEAIVMFADTRKKDMSPIQKALYIETVKYINTYDCNYKELEKISNAFYGEVVKGKYGYQQRRGKAASTDFLSDVRLEVEKRADNNNLTKDILEKYNVLNFTFNIDYLAGNIEIKKVSRGYAVKYSSQYYDYVVGHYEGGQTGIHAVKYWCISSNQEEISYIGRGVDGALSTYKEAIKELYDYLKTNKTTLAGEAGYSACMELLGEGLELVETGGSKVLIIPNVMKTLIEKGKDNYEAERAYSKCKGFDNAIIFDMHIVESSNSVRSNMNFAKGENTQTIINHINKVTGSNLMMERIEHEPEKVDEALKKYREIRNIETNSPMDIRDYIREEIENWEHLDAWMNE